MAIVTARSAPIVSAASHTGIYPFFKGTARIWNWRTGEHLSEFPTVYDGMSRHALSPDGEFYIAANWRKGKDAGVACYCTRTGERIWHQSGLRQVQGIRFSAQGDKVWCCVEGRPVHCLDSRTGSILTKLRNVDEVVESTHSHFVLHSRRRADYLIVGRNTKAVPRLTPSMSDAVFSSDALCLAEYTGPVRCLDCETGQERWRYLPPRGFHVIALSQQVDEAFYGYLFGYESPEAALLRFSPDSGTCAEVCRYDLSKRHGGDFGQGVFIAGNGDVLSLLDGRVVREMPFSQPEN
jgi:hypothetical protein